MKLNRRRALQTVVLSQCQYRCLNPDNLLCRSAPSANRDHNLECCLHLRLYFLGLHCCHCLLHCLVFGLPRFGLLHFHSSGLHRCHAFHGLHRLRGHASGLPRLQSHAAGVID